MRSIPILVVALGCAASAHAQIPQQFENLKVLPADIARDSLLTIMRGFSLGLGVRCVHCHVGVDSPTLANVDFKSDERDAKRIAREMMKLTAAANQVIAGLPERGPTALRVQCATCHRGMRRPVTLEDTILVVARAQGGAAAVVAYDSLRQAFYGRAAFDFGPFALVRAAERLNTERRHEDAVALLLRNAEANPRFWNTFFELGRSYEALGRKDDAIAAYRATLERLPGHAPSLARLRALGG